MFPSIFLQCTFYVVVQTLRAALPAIVCFETIILISQVDYSVISKKQSLFLCDTNLFYSFSQEIGPYLSPAIWRKQTVVPQNQKVIIGSLKMSGSCVNSYIHRSLLVSWQLGRICDSKSRHSCVILFAALTLVNLCSSTDLEQLFSRSNCLRWREN